MAPLQEVCQRAASKELLQRPNFVLGHSIKENVSEVCRALVLTLPRHRALIERGACSALIHTMLVYHFSRMWFKHQHSIVCCFQVAGMECGPERAWTM
jgi:hypothetical protein